MIWTAHRRPWTPRTASAWRPHHRRATRASAAPAVSPQERVPAQVPPTETSASATTPSICRYRSPVGLRRLTMAPTMAFLGAFRVAPGVPERRRRRP